MSNSSKSFNSDAGFSYPKFNHQVRAVFQHSVSEVEVDFYHLPHGDCPVSHHTAESCTLAVQTTQSDSSLQTAFYEGLPCLKDELNCNGKVAMLLQRPLRLLCLLKPLLCHLPSPSRKLSDLGNRKRISLV